ncbi:exodeoxyribonuclease III [Limibacter armeniacum]|uniref:exodeoxyribonuclease III n=1 Tax=Limibacter armeniacum TaxID=466084 RepID=UPI002FE642C3
MKIISYNVNGIRAAMNKGLIDWLKEENPDVICFQEVKAEENQVALDEFHKLGYENIYWFSAQKKGYSGVAVASKVKAVGYSKGMGVEAYDNEGRTIKVDFPDFSLINAYFPSGTSGEERQQFKYSFLEDFNHYIDGLKSDQPNLVICGDFNICHKPIDIHNPVSNKNSSGFLPEEREWVTDFMEKREFQDAFRSFVEAPHRYSWWTYRAGARKNNKGWRIDYFMVANSMKDKMTNSDILDQVVHSDHCPVMLQLHCQN